MELNRDEWTERLGLSGGFRESSKLDVVVHSGLSRDL